MNINTYLEKNCDINHYRDNLIEENMNEFNIYSLSYYELLEKEKIFDYSPIFKDFYLSKLFHDRQPYSKELYEHDVFHEDYIKNSIHIYNHQFKKIDTRMTIIREEIKELKAIHGEQHIKLLLIDKENIQGQIIHKDKNAFELISLNDKLDTLEKTIKQKKEELRTIPLLIQHKQREIDILKKDILYYIRMIKFFELFPYQDYQDYLYINQKNKNRDMVKNIVFILFGIYFMSYHCRFVFY